MRIKLMFSYVKLTMGGVVLLSLLSSCVNHKNAVMIRERGQSTQELTIDNPRETSYRIQTGDQLYIKVHSLDPKTSRFFQSDIPNLMNNTYLYLNSYTVDDGGFIGFSFIEKQHVQGQTVAEAQSSLQKVLNEYFNEISIVLKLIDFQISIMGEVESPGTYSINREYANILQAISLAGGVTSYANLTRAKLIRQTPKGTNVKFIDLSNLDLLEKEYYHLMPNDIIYIDPRPIKSYVSREVPYSLFLSLLSTGVLIYTIFVK